MSSWQLIHFFPEKVAVFLCLYLLYFLSQEGNFIGSDTGMGPIFLLSGPALQTGEFAGLITLTSV